MVIKVPKWALMGFIRYSLFTFHIRRSSLESNLIFSVAQPNSICKLERYRCCRDSGNVVIKVDFSAEQFHPPEEYFFRFSFLFTGKY